jgi:hypothetical protein
MTVVIYPSFIKDMSKRPTKFQAASGTVKRNNFSPSITKVEFLMKSEKRTSMKEPSAEFKVGTTMIYGLE